MEWFHAVAPSDCLSLGPWVSALGLVCSSQRCASDSSSPPSLVSASAQPMNTKNKQQQFINLCQSLHEAFTCYASFLPKTILKRKRNPSHSWKPTLASTCWCLSVAWLSSWLVLARFLSRSVRSLRAWFSWVCSSCSLEAWLRISFSWLDRFLSNSDTRPRSSDEKTVLLNSKEAKFIFQR